MLQVQKPIRQEYKTNSLIFILFSHFNLSFICWLFPVCIWNILIISTPNFSLPLLPTSNMLPFYIHAIFFFFIFVIYWVQLVVPFETLTNLVGFLYRFVQLQWVHVHSHVMSGGQHSQYMWYRCPLRDEHSSSHWFFNICPVILQKVVWQYNIVRRQFDNMSI